MKTIRQIANEIGVSKQAVYKRYKGKLYKAVFPYARKVCDTIYILEQGEIVIKQDFLNDKTSKGAHTEYTQDTIISMLQKELKIKNKQIADLTAVIKTQTTRKTYSVRKRTARKEPSIPIQRVGKRVKDSL